MNNPTIWIDAFSVPEHFYRLWMGKRKNRRKARFKKKLQRIIQRNRKDGGQE